MNKNNTERLLDLLERLAEAMEKLADKEPDQVIVQQNPTWVPTTLPTTVPVPVTIPFQGPGLPGIFPEPWKQPFVPGNPHWITNIGVNPGLHTNGPGPSILKFGNQTIEPEGNFGGLRVVSDPSVEPGTIRVVSDPADLTATMTGRVTDDMSRTTSRVTDDMNRMTSRIMEDNLRQTYRKSAEKDPETA